MKSRKTRPAKAKDNKLAIVKSSAAFADSTVVKPAPKKSEIITALVERARVKHGEEQAALKAKRDAARGALDEAVYVELTAHRENFTKKTCCWNGGVEVEFRMTVLKPHIKKLYRTWEALPKLRDFDESEVKRLITSKMAAGADSRIKQMLADPETIKKLDATLEAIAA